MKKRFVIIVAVALIAVFGASSVFADDICKKPVQTNEGAVIGAAEPESPACVYKGVPYAAPPVGKLRWRPPEPAAKRDKVFEATQFGPECKQIGMGVPKIFSRYDPARSEDCLTLNIWKPKKEGVYPVMVWIHGGALVSGAGSEANYRSDRLSSQKEVIVVTFNYRLGAMGFLAHKDLSAEDSHGSSGNYGMLDQIAALDWVKKNISAFGGDPNNVTIFGESAGGWSVCNLMASPLAAGLFGKAILESGGCDAAHSMETGFAIGDQFAKKVGCSGDKPLECLRAKPADEIIAAMGNVEDEIKHAANLKPWNPQWTPHIDGWVLKDVPLKALQSGAYNHVPLMVGSNRDEYKMFVVLSKERKIKKKAIVEMTQKVMGPDLAKAFYKLYPFEKYRKAADALWDALGDVALGCKCLDAAEASSKYQPTYYYRFDFDDFRLRRRLGAAHAFELPFVFGNMDRPYFKLAYSNGQRKRAKPLMNSIMSYWTNFAKTGDPNGANLTVWPKYDTDTRMRMFLDLPPHVAPTDNIEKCEFWRANLPKAK